MCLRTEIRFTHFMILIALTLKLFISFLTYKNLKKLLPLNIEIDHYKH